MLVADLAVFVFVFSFFFLILSLRAGLDLSYLLPVLFWFLGFFVFFCFDPSIQLTDFPDRNNTLKCVHALLDTYEHSVIDTGKV